VDCGILMHLCNPPIPLLGTPSRAYGDDTKQEYEPTYCPLEDDMMAGASSMRLSW